MIKNFHAVESSRKWRDRVTRAVTGMNQREKIAHFEQYNSLDALKAKRLPTKALPTVVPAKSAKHFDAVSEARKWRTTARRRKLIAA